MPSQVSLKAIFCGNFSQQTRYSISKTKINGQIRSEHLKHLDPKYGTQKNLLNEMVLLSTQNTC